MQAPNIGMAANLRVVGQRLEAAAAKLDGAFEQDRGYRWRPWGMRGGVHEQLDAAAVEFEQALAAMPAGDSGFNTAREAIQHLASGSRAERIGGLGPARDLNWYRRDAMRDLGDSARGWATLVREGARVLEDPATTPATMRASAIESALAVSRDAVDKDAFIRLAVLDELPGDLRPDLPMPLAAGAVHIASGADPYVGDVGEMLGSWARRQELMARPGFDRAAATEELAHALDHSDPREALHVVAAIDQLPGHVRPDLPHVTGDWNWTKAQNYRNPGTHERYVEALRTRLDDLRASTEFTRAPASTVDEVQRLVGTAYSEVSPGTLRPLRDLPGFPPSLIPAEGNIVPFDVIRTRIWADAQRLAAIPNATREDMVAELQSALVSLERRSSLARAGGAGSGTDLANRLEHTRPVLAALTPHDALIRVAAIDSLPATLRPDLPDLIAIGSRVDAAAHQSAQAFDHQRDLLRLQAWAAQFPRRAAPSELEAGTAPQTDAQRSALRRFLDPSEEDAHLPPLSRPDQADVLVDVLSSAGSFAPRLHHAALGAAVRYLDDATVTDPHVRTLVERTLETARRNVAWTEGHANPGYAYHPDYAELGGIAESIKLLKAFEALDARPTPSAASSTLTW